MYMKLLEETIRELKGEEIEDDHRATVNLRVDLKIEDSYIPDMNQRLMIYRKVAAARNDSELDMALEEARDRYGAPPPSVLNLAEYGRIRIMADRLGVESIDREGRLVVIRFRPLAKIDPMRLVTVVGKWPGATLVPPVSLKLDLDAAAAASKPSTSPGGADTKRLVPASSAKVLRPEGSVGRAASGGRSRTPPQPSSWWASRATAGEVTPGFNKEDITRRPEGDPRAAGGMFSQLERLLKALGS
jgi:transcription-repair coupling factor (superfamily II helicase)